MSGSAGNETYWLTDSGVNNEDQMAEQVADMMLASPPRGGKH